MKTIKLLWISILMLLTFSLPIYGDVSITSECAVVMDMDTGQVLYDKNGYQINNMGNMTKLLNVSTAINNEEPAKLLSVTENCLAETTQDSLATTIGLRSGQAISLEDALYAEILSNANDAARVVAGNLGHTEESSTIGTIDDVKNYLKMMRSEADYLTAASVSIASVMGLWSPDQVCNTMDLGNMVRLGFEDSTFRRILTAKEKDITVYTETRRTVTVDTEEEENQEENNGDSDSSNENRENEEDDNKVEETTTEVVTSDGETTTLTSEHNMVNGTINNRSVKGGFVVKTENNGYHSVTYAKRNIENQEGETEPRKIVVAIMNSPNEEAMYEDIETLTNHGFEDWETFTLAGNKLDDYLPDDLKDKDIVFSQDMQCLAPKNTSKDDLTASAAVNENTFTGGTLTFTVDNFSHPIYQAAFYEDDNEFVLSSGLRTAIYIIVALVVLGIIFLLLRNVIIPNYYKAKRITAKTGSKGNRPRKPDYKKNGRSGAMTEKQGRASSSAPSSGQRRTRKH